MTPCRCAAASASAIFGGDRQRLLERQRPLLEALRERLARDVLHHQVGGAVVLAHVVERADVRMAQAGDGPRLALETGAATWVGAELGRQNLDGDAAIEARVASPCTPRPCRPRRWLTGSHTARGACHVTMSRLHLGLESCQTMAVMV